MADLLVDFVNYLINQGKATADGTDIFRDNMPDSPNNLISVFESMGSAAFSCDAVNRSVQLQIRNKSYSAGKTKIDGLFSLFQKNEIEDRQIWLTATRWSIISCTGTPFKLKEDESKRTIFLFNLSVITHKD